MRPLNPFSVRPDRPRPGIVFGLLLSGWFAAGTATSQVTGETLEGSHWLASLGGERASVTVADMDAIVASSPEEVAGRYMIDPDLIGQTLTNTLLRRAVIVDLRSGAVELPDFEARAAEAEDQALAELWLARALKAGVPEDLEERARAEYEAYPERFMKPRTVDVRHLLVSFDDRDPEAALELASSLRKQVVDGEATFEDLVEAHSDDPSKEHNGGMIPDVHGRGLVPEFKRAALALAMDVVSEPVRTEYGYHLIVVEQEYPAAPVAFADAREGILDELESKFIEETRREIQATYGEDVARMASEARALGLSEQSPVAAAFVRQGAEKYLMPVLRAHLGADIDRSRLAGLARQRYLAYPERFEVPASVDYEYVSLAAANLDDERRELLRNQLNGFSEEQGEDLKAFLESELSDVNFNHQVQQSSRMLDLPIPVSLDGDAADELPAGVLVEEEKYWTFLWVTGYTPPRRPAFDELRDGMVEKLETELEQRNWARFLDAYRSLPLDADQQAMAVLKDRYGVERVDSLRYALLGVR